MGMRPSRNSTLIGAFAATIKARRLELNLTQKDFAGRVELDRPYITLIEGGAKQPTISVLWRLATGLDLTVSELSSLVDTRLEQTRQLESEASAPLAKRTKSK